MKNKYQVSLSCIKYYCGHFNKAVETAVKKAVKNLQELVNRDEPKMAIWVPDAYGDMVQVCPNCKQRITNVWSSAEYKPKYCHFCGQHLEWKDKDE